MDGPAFPTDWPSPPSSGGRATAAAASGGGFHPFGKDGFRFRDLVDIINPLQHIPILSTIYRKITGDVLDPLPRLAGGALFGGIAGAVSAVTNLVVNGVTGRDIGETAFALLGNGLGLSGGERSGPEMLPEMVPEMVAEMPASQPPHPTFSAGWQAAVAMQYCDAECLDPKKSFFNDAMSMASAFPGANQAAARYAEATGLAATGGHRLDMRG